MKVNGMKEKETAMVFLLKEMVIILKVIGLTINVRVKVLTFIVIKINSLLENG